MTVDLPLLYTGKVRDVYDAGEDRLLMVMSDRLSAFDVVMAEPVPEKGRMLTAISVFCALSDAIIAAGEGKAFPTLDAPATPERVLRAVEEVRGC